MQEMDALEKEMTTHSNIPAWKFHEQRSLVGHSPWGRKELNTTERLSTHANTQLVLNKL